MCVSTVLPQVPLIMLFSMMQSFHASSKLLPAEVAAPTLCPTRCMQPHVAVFEIKVFQTDTIFSEAQPIPQRTLSPLLSSIPSILYFDKWLPGLTLYVHSFVFLLGVPNFLLLHSDVTFQLVAHIERFCDIKVHFITL